MVVVLLGGQSGRETADPDDDKARQADALHQKLRMQLADSAFVAALPPGGKAKLEAQLSALWFSLAVYRNELLKASRANRASSPMALATTQTMSAAGPKTGTPADALIALAVLAGAAIAVVVTTKSKNVVSVGNQLEGSMGDIKTTTTEYSILVTPLEIGFSPNIKPDILKKFIRIGVIIQTGGLLAITIQKIRDYIESVYEELNKTGRKNGCEEEEALLISLVEKLSKFIAGVAESVGSGDIDKVNLAKILKMMEEIEEAFAALRNCMAGSGGGPTTPPTNKPN